MRSYYDSWQHRAFLHERERAAREQAPIVSSRVESIPPAPVERAAPAAPSVLKRLLACHEISHGICYRATGGQKRYELQVFDEPRNGDYRGWFSIVDDLATSPPTPGEYPASEAAFRDAARKVVAGHFGASSFV
jgi:hypothetical protein